MNRNRKLARTYCTVTEFVGPEHPKASRIYVARTGAFVFEGKAADGRRPGYFDNEATAIRRAVELDAESIPWNEYKADPAPCPGSPWCECGEDGPNWDDEQDEAHSGNPSELAALQWRAWFDAELNSPAATAVARTIPWFGKTADQWRRQGRDEGRASYESFERCDTDGFLSQWAHDQLRHHYSACAEYALEGGTASADVVFDLEGNMVEGVWIDTKFGRSFMMGPRGEREFFSPSQARTDERRRRTDAAKGFYLGRGLVRVAVNPRSTRFEYGDEVVAVSDDGVHKLYAPTYE